VRLKCAFICVSRRKHRESEGCKPRKNTTTPTYTNNYYLHKLDSKLKDREPQQEKQQQQENQQRQQQQQQHKTTPPQPQKTPPQPRENSTVYTWRDLADDDKIEEVWQKTLACGLEKHRVLCNLQKEESICADYKVMPDKKLGQSLRSSGYCDAPGTIDEEDSIEMANIIQNLQR
jgi:hypothetical protein